MKKVIMIVPDVPDDLDIGLCRAKAEIKQFIFHVSVEGNAYVYATPIITDWCPLKSLPEPITEHDTKVSFDYAQGWNDCINEILGEENELS